MHHFIQYLGALLHVSYVHDTNCMTTCFIGNIGEKLGELCQIRQRFLPAKVLLYILGSIRYSTWIQFVGCMGFFMKFYRWSHFRIAGILSVMSIIELCWQISRWFRTLSQKEINTLIKQSSFSNRAIIL